MKEFIAQNGGLIAFVVMVMTALNFVLMGLQKALEVIKDKTDTNLDNKAYAVINTVTEILVKVIDWFSGNRKHA